ncbi:hypothetical protein EFO17_08055 [Lactococcus lactis]|nr:hypothetical protein [Lactococcus lactis]
MFKTKNKNRNIVQYFAQAWSAWAFFIYSEVRCTAKSSLSCRTQRDDRLLEIIQILQQLLLEQLVSYKLFSSFSLLIILIQTFEYSCSTL